MSNSDVTDNSNKTEQGKPAPLSEMPSKSSNIKDEDQDQELTDDGLSEVAGGFGDKEGG